MPTYLAIVAREHASVYETLKETFEAPSRPDTRVRVLWDRREADRRQHRAPVTAELRQQERRRRPPETWATLGFMFVAEEGS